MLSLISLHVHNAINMSSVTYTMLETLIFFEAALVFWGSTSGMNPQRGCAVG